jgi:anti-sigma B factor antagonist
MEFESRQFADVCIGAAFGRIDHNSAAAFEGALLSKLEGAQYSTLVLNLAGVDYMSSVGLRALMVASKTAKTQGISIVLAAPTDTLAEIFEISRFNMVFKIYDCISDALGAVSAEALESYTA